MPKTVRREGSKTGEVLSNGAGYLAQPWNQQNCPSACDESRGAEEERVL